MITAARPTDLPRFRDIETAAGELFREIGMDTIADDPPLSEAELAPYLRDGRAWVAANAADHLIAYILFDIIDGWAHIEQVTVHPLHSRKGFGSYERLGFLPIHEQTWPNGLRKVVQSEIQHGLNAWPRVVMNKEIDHRSQPG